MYFSSLVYYLYRDLFFFLQNYTFFTYIFLFHKCIVSYIHINNKNILKLENSKAVYLSVVSHDHNHMRVCTYTANISNRGPRKVTETTKTTGLNNITYRYIINLKILPSPHKYFFRIALDYNIVFIS